MPACEVCSTDHCSELGMQCSDCSECCSAPVCSDCLQFSLQDTVCCSKATITYSDGQDNISDPCKGYEILPTKRSTVYRQALIEIIAVAECSASRGVGRAAGTVPESAAAARRGRRSAGRPTAAASRSGSTGGTTARPGQNRPQPRQTENKTVSTATLLVTYFLCL